ncbi:MAG: hypothetical protein A3H88_03245 [Candidatus Blackburnbacteria bacterium RIFCSPLOWO2_02_FULL_44_9]|uniref:Uncharacterized protein n=1 Tax=Candidatus Blackburnbacteria bacterium RIFCSPHIGHO2_02_FULL_44_20 TaxID=1797516 RepID=A0A1G1V578_9BACT|nr:MAG: hypothetical protein A3D26_00395 [Candidatus Blackburnbacteria bacterium RIFCSPHIGHO2_02_FULL_44_20]OGY11631.1 MAG: hypothetical protein A3E16_01370 [Candidatus Blackburnbacteria bacterium RIFCSPHIGHO2_12_FULL_44_25]OGY15573.1 MAG: hypothetical protein A3H88_03245 [Candidatus Blackburnbacteria bacterium RIFCSPLOWO2_02_FULL_44_9]
MELAALNNPLSGRLSPPSGDAAIGSFDSIVTSIISLFFIVGILLFFFYFIISAYQWITSSGDPKAVEKARNGVVHSIVGLVVLFSVYAILGLFGLIFGIDILQLDIAKLKI